MNITDVSEHTHVHGRQGQSSLFHKFKDSAWSHTWPPPGSQIPQVLAHIAQGHSLQTSRSSYPLAIL